jgi:hypothetical protein
LLHEKLDIGRVLSGRELGAGIPITEDHQVDPVSTVPVRADRHDRLRRRADGAREDHQRWETVSRAARSGGHHLPASLRD